MSEQADASKHESSNGAPRPQQRTQREGEPEDGRKRSIIAIAPSASAAEEQAQESSGNGNGNNSADQSHDASAAGAAGAPKKKRRKVNHACVYCRRSHMTCDLERPCARCIKRDIGHLCRDEPREPTKRTKSEQDIAPAQAKVPHNGISSSTDLFQPFDQGDGGLVMGQGKQIMDAPQLVQPKPMSPAQLQKPQGTQSQAQVQPQAQTQGDSVQPFAMNDWGPQDQFNDMHNLSNYGFGTLEVTNEYNLLGDFLSNSLLDDGALFANDDAQALFNDPLLSTTSLNTYVNNVAPLMPNQSGNSGSSTAMLPPQVMIDNEISRPPSTFSVDTKARDKFYMTAADPAGNDTPEERMNKLLKAKYDAGMLKPFNYVKGYARLNQYMEKNMKPNSRQKILRQLEKFRPKFREAMHALTDIQLVLVEMWFERSLMEYDRVFASMVIPACCWRRTGEIFRGNKEMAELIHLPIEELRDGKHAIHEIMAEDSLVSYWEKFGAIAFDQSQKAILTSCWLKNPDAASKDPTLRCCFSFTIRRDTHNIPALIIGNFLPVRS